jgi:hypothetical protein
LRLFLPADHSVAPLTKKWLLIGEFGIIFTSCFTFQFLVANLRGALDAHLKVEINFTFFFAHFIEETRAVMRKAARTSFL